MATRKNVRSTIGYPLLKVKQVGIDIAVFQLHVTVNPTAWNPYDSLEQA